MVSSFANTERQRRVFSRRCGLQVGALHAVGLTSTHLAKLRAGMVNEPRAAKRRQTSCVFLFLFGGPSQIDLWDMKPNASAEIRGEFQPIATNVPGIQICEHLPKLAQQMDKVCLMRSMQHKMNVHGPACSEVFSGRPYHSAPITDEATPEDWPALSAMTMRYGNSQTGLPPSVVLPWYLQFPGQGVRIAGQTGGRMGERHDAMPSFRSMDSRRIRRSRWRGLRTGGDCLNNCNWVILNFRIPRNWSMTLIAIVSVRSHCCNTRLAKFWTCSVKSLRSVMPTGAHLLDRVCSWRGG